MSSDYEQQRSRLSGEHTEQPNEEPWADLELSLPHGRSPTGIVSVVERVLVELTHEDVGAEFVSTNLTGVKRTQFIAVDDVGQRFQKRYFDDRLGWHETIVSRGAVRNELVSRLSRLSLDRIDEPPNGEPDTFRVMSLHQF
ncbi:hypothetical protein [Haloferax denitrificans]|uniref:hypothetical protein n=1 Tax=Haloferax denitrificans TaxID=35745 RepID=UPI000678324E|nr:hypothetical protein [Haloferax denitrificans]